MYIQTRTLEETKLQIQKAEHLQKYSLVLRRLKTFQSQGSKHKRKNYNRKEGSKTWTADNVQLSDIKNEKKRKHTSFCFLLQIDARDHKRLDSPIWHQLPEFHFLLRVGDRSPGKI